MRCKSRTYPVWRNRVRSRSRDPELGRLDGSYWWLVGIATILTLGRFSEAFLLLAAEYIGLSLALIPGVLVMMNVV